ncbi:hypothetical protein AMTR_s01245p00010370, partial [Amborella trichopoda]
MGLGKNWTNFENCFADLKVTMMMHGEFLFIGMLGHSISLFNLRSGQRSELKWSTRKFG